MEDRKITPLITVIIPCYNGEKTLGKCLDSVRKQTFSRFQVLIVDDGSTDRTKASALKYCRQDGRFCLICGSHKGVSAARNTALRQAETLYVCFLDADDTLPERALEWQVKGLEEHPEADLAIGCFDTGDDRLFTGGDMEGLLGMESVREHFSRHIASVYYGGILGKLYRTRLIKDNGLVFPENIRWSEDMLFNLDYLKCCRNVCYVKRKVYYYDFRPKSVTDDYSVYWKTQVLRMEKAAEFLEESEQKVVRERFCSYFYWLLNAELSTMVKRKSSIHQKWEGFHEILDECRPLWDKTGQYGFYGENRTQRLLGSMLKRGYRKRLFLFYMVKNFLRGLPGIGCFYKGRQKPYLE